VQARRRRDHLRRLHEITVFPGGINTNIAEGGIS
jgi:hypothetical protein